MLTIRTKITILASLFVAAFAAFAVIAWNLQSQSQVTGPLYGMIVADKDLVADLRAPAQSLLEPYLVVLQLVADTDTAAQKDRIGALQKMASDYDVRRAYWLQTLPAGALKDGVTDASARTAHQFFDVVRDKFIPAVLADKADEAASVANTQLAPLYASHGQALAGLVDTADSQITDLESQAVRGIAHRASLLVGLALVLIAAVIIFSTWLTINMVKPFVFLYSALTDQASPHANEARLNIPSPNNIMRLRP